MKLSFEISTLRIFITYPSYLPFTYTTQESVMNRNYLPPSSSPVVIIYSDLLKEYSSSRLLNALSRISLYHPILVSQMTLLPALLVLSNLYFLSILDTSIDMHGLRLLAKTIRKEEREREMFKFPLFAMSILIVSFISLVPPS